ncbi:Golgin subfamily A member 7/ERF4 family-domain-containing protein [Lactifluus volemus]|nr:Golgin subfamily A member 7/ERF4 family-domain-containing protein [Lactifluus volemus]
MKRSVPVSSYYYGPPPADSAYFTPPLGQIGVHHPREIVRVERDYSGGEIVQFASTFPMELEGRITPTQFLESINAINEVLISAYNLWRSVVDNCVEILSLQLSRLFLSTHYQREMSRLQRLMDELNRQLFNPVGLNMLWPRKVGFLFVS